MFLGQDIYLSDFPDKNRHNADSLFKNEKSGLFFICPGQKLTFVPMKNGLTGEPIGGWGGWAYERILL